MDRSLETGCGPRFEPGVFVSAVVVHNQTDVQIPRHIGLDDAQEARELLIPVAWLALRNDRAMQHIEGRKQRRGALALVIVRDSFDVLQFLRQHQLVTFQSLVLAFLVHPQCKGVLRRVEVQPDYIAQLPREERIGGEFEALGETRFDAEELGVAVHVAFREFGLGYRRPHFPVCAAVLGLRVLSFANQRRYEVRVNRARAPRVRFVIQPGDAVFQKALAPLANGRLRELMTRSYGAIVVSRCCGQRNRARVINAGGIERDAAIEDSLALFADPQRQLSLGRKKYGINYWDRILSEDRRETLSGLRRPLAR